MWNAIIIKYCIPGQVNAVHVNTQIDFDALSMEISFINMGCQEEEEKVQMTDLTMSASYIKVSDNFFKCKEPAD